MTDRPASAIPGPRLPALVQTIQALFRTPDGAVEYARQFGDIFQVRLLRARHPEDRGFSPLLTGTIVMVTSPDLMRQVFAQPGSVLAGGEARRFAEWIVGPRSLLLLDGDAHLRERRGLLAMFGNDRLPRLDTLYQTAITRSIARMPNVVNASLADILDDVNLDGAMRLLFGELNDAQSAKAHRIAKGAYDPLPWSWPFLLLPWMRKDFGRLSPGRQIQHTIREGRELVTEQVGRVRAGDAAAVDSQLADFLALEDGEETEDTRAWRMDRVLTLVIAADTVSAALRWCFFHLLQHPDLLDRCVAEARATDPADDAARTGFLDATCREAVRIHPAVPILVRRVLAPVSIGGYMLEPGMHLLGNMYMAHRRPELFPEPERFRPERFLERSFSPYEFVPFGGGVRRCLGAGVGFRQMQMLLAALLRAFDIRATGRYRFGARRRAVLMVPTDPLPVTMTRVAAST